MHHANTRLQGVKRRGKLHLLSVNKNVTFVPAGLPDDIHAKEDLHQGTFAGAVLAHKTQHLAGLQREVDVGKHLVAEEIFFDVPHFQ